MLAAPSDNVLAVAGSRPGNELATVPQSFQAPGPGRKQRTSSLESPIMLLTGHQSAVYTMNFNPAGTVLASSGSHDKDIFLWYVHGDCKNYMVLRGHKKCSSGPPVDHRWNPVNLSKP